MRIGELADTVGMSTRSVRHYHHMGLLPEPERDTNGYRVYGVRDAVVLARIRRLSELGLSLAEVHDALRRDGERDLREILTHLDADLAEQQRAMGKQRERLAALLQQETLHQDDPLSPDMAAVFRALPHAESGVLATERGWLALLDTTAPEEDHQRVIGLLTAATRDPEKMARLGELYAALDELSEATPDDPRVPQLAADLAAALPDVLAELLPHNAAEMLSGHSSDTSGSEAPLAVGDFLADLPPAQVAVVQEVFRLLQPAGAP